MGFVQLENIKWVLRNSAFEAKRVLIAFMQGIYVSCPFRDHNIFVF